MLAMPACPPECDPQNHITVESENQVLRTVSDFHTPGVTHRAVHSHTWTTTTKKFKNNNIGNISTHFFFIYMYVCPSILLYIHKFTY